MARGFMNLVAVMDWFSRYVLAWRLSNTMDTALCLDALTAALVSGRQPPAIFNTDQGAQFSAEAFVELVLGAGAAMSMDGRGRWLDNRFIERLWRSYKYEDVYLRAYDLLPKSESSEMGAQREPQGSTRITDTGSGMGRNRNFKRQALFASLAILALGFSSCASSSSVGGRDDPDEPKVRARFLEEPVKVANVIMRAPAIATGAVPAPFAGGSMNFGS